MDREEFGSFLAAIRHGDEQAWRTLVDFAGPGLKQAVNARLKNSRLQHVADVDDIAQSAFFRFHNHALIGDFSLETFEQLQSLLNTIALNRLRDLRKKGGAAARVDVADPRRVPNAATTACQARYEGSSPSQHATVQELVREVQRRLSKKSAQIHKWRAEGLSWPNIAEILNEPPQAVRIRFAREIQRVTQSLGIDDGD